MLILSVMLCQNSLVKYISDIGVSQPMLSEEELTFNPYPHLGSPESNAWPRGYPLDLIMKIDSAAVEKVSESVNFGVLQSLADLQPDVDAIFRLTRKSPFIFKRPDVKKLTGNGNFFN